MYSTLLPLLQPDSSEWSYKAVLCTFDLHVFACAVPSTSDAFRIPQSKSYLFLDKSYLFVKPYLISQGPIYFTFLPPSFLPIDTYVCMSALKSFWMCSLFRHLVWFDHANVLWCTVTLYGMDLLA